jgi:hypothetical protein
MKKYLLTILVLVVGLALVFMYREPLMALLYQTIEGQNDLSPQEAQAELEVAQEEEVVPLSEIELADGELFFEGRVTSKTEDLWQVEVVSRIIGELPPQVVLQAGDCTLIEEPGATHHFSIVLDESGAYHCVSVSEPSIDE